MNEEPKSIWKKSWTGRSSVLLLSLLSAAIVFLVGLIYALANWERPVIETFTQALLAGSVCLGILFLLVFVVWPMFRLLIRQWRRALFGLACFATLLALFYAEENWRGKHDWEKFKREWEAKGEKFDFKDFVPPAVPDDQNFALTPVVASCYANLLTRDGRRITSGHREGSTNIIHWVMTPDGTKISSEIPFTNVVNRLSFDFGDFSWKTNATGYWAKGTVSNLKLWQDFYRDLATKTNLFSVSPQPQSPAADVLLALSKYDGVVEELRQASLLPKSRFPLNYDVECPAVILLPHLAAMKRCSQLLQLRAIAELQNSQSDKAAADVQLTLRLVGFLRSGPTIIDQLVRVAMTEIILQPIYEGLANHQWTDAQLVALDAELAKLDFLADYQFSMRSERAASCKIIDYLKKRSYQRYMELFVAMSGDGGTTASEQLKNKAIAAGLYLMPDGWFEQNKLFLANQQQAWITGVIFPENQLAAPQKFRDVEQSEASALKNASGLWSYFAKEFLPALGAVGRKAAREQISVNLARTAIALERYRLAHGEFPESLDALAPQFIAQVPHDIIGGKPLKYRRTNDGLFVLYSVGWNETDDGGVTFIPNGGSQPKFEEGDWVWRYPQK